MNALPPNTRFSLFGGTYQIDYNDAGNVRFHNVSDIYDVWQLSENWLQKKLNSGRLKVMLDNTTPKENT
jgi:hypothetical protein